MIVTRLHKLIGNCGMFTTVVLMTVGMVALSVILTTVFMWGMKAPWWDVGTKLAIICPLVATPPIVYLFLRLIEKLNALNMELEQALSEVKELSGLLPVCAWCKKIAMTKAIGASSNHICQNTPIRKSRMVFVPNALQSCVIRQEDKEWVI